MAQKVRRGRPPSRTLHALALFPCLSFPFEWLDALHRGASCCRGRSRHKERPSKERKGRATKSTPCHDVTIPQLLLGEWMADLDERAGTERILLQTVLSPWYSPHYSFHYYFTSHNFANPGNKRGPQQRGTGRASHHQKAVCSPSY